MLSDISNIIIEDEFIIIVTSDGDHILNIARLMGVTTHKRDEYYASSQCTGSEFFENLAKSIENKL